MTVAVRKFRRIEDVPDHPARANALDGLRAACELSELAAAIGIHFAAPRGVRRFRSIEELDEHRRSWELPDRDPGDNAS